MGSDMKGEWGRQMKGEKKRRRLGRDLLRACAGEKVDLK